MTLTNRFVFFGHKNRARIKNARIRECEHFLQSILERKHVDTVFKAGVLER